MRLLHLLDAGSPQASATTLALLNESLGRLGHTEQRVLLMGPSSLQTAARSVGINDAALVGLPCRQVILGWPSIRRRIATWAPESPNLSGNDEGNSGGGYGPLDGFDLIHCWSIGAFGLASLAWRSVPRLLTLTTPPSATAVRWLRILNHETKSRGVILPISATLRRQVLSGGVPEEAVHVLRPGLSMGMVDHAARAALRKRWGVNDSTKVIMLLSDPPQANDAMAAVMAAGLAEESCRARKDPPSIRVVMHPDQRRRSRAEALCRDVNQPYRVIQEPMADLPWAVLPGCDLALAQDEMESDAIAGGAAGGGLSLTWAMAANVPIVGNATYAVSEIVEDRHSALLCKPGQPRALAHRITQLIDDKLLAYKLRDTARHEAYSFFSRQRYCESLQVVYDQVLSGRPIEVPELPTTGGLRFTGRA